MTAKKQSGRAPITPDSVRLMWVLENFDIMARKHGPWMHTPFPSLVAGGIQAVRNAIDTALLAPGRAPSEETR